jgi:hypothetical protein
VLHGPANRPAVFFGFFTAVLALALLIGLVLKGRWIELGFVGAVLVLPEVWRRIRPTPRAGRVRRSWPWHDDWR